MPYLLRELWTIPDLTNDDQPISGSPTDADGADDVLLAAACQDCGHYNFPPHPRCRTCGSPAIQTVSVAAQSHPHALVFGTTHGSRKPN